MNSSLKRLEEIALVNCGINVCAFRLSVDAFEEAELVKRSNGFVQALPHLGEKKDLFKTKTLSKFALPRSPSDT